MFIYMLSLLTRLYCNLKRLAGKVCTANERYEKGPQERKATNSK